MQHEDKLYFFGGLSGACQALDEILVLWLEPVRWESLPLEGQSSLCRLFGHQSILHDNLIYILGGRKYLSEEAPLEAFQNMTKSLLVQIEGVSADFPEKTLSFQEQEFPCGKRVALSLSEGKTPS